MLELYDDNTGIGSHLIGAWATSWCKIHLCVCQSANCHAQLGVGCYICSGYGELPPYNVKSLKTWVKSLLILYKHPSLTIIVYCICPWHERLQRALCMVTNQMFPFATLWSKSLGCQHGNPSARLGQKTQFLCHHVIHIVLIRDTQVEFGRCLYVIAQVQEVRCVPAVQWAWRTLALYHSKPKSCGIPISWSFFRLS